MFVSCGDEFVQILLFVGPEWQVDLDADACDKDLAWKMEIFAQRFRVLSYGCVTKISVAEFL